MRSQEEKDLLLADLKRHQEADDFVRGSWLGQQKENGEYRGCFYGCTMQSDKDPRGEFAEKHGIDLWYCYLTEEIFEGLPEDQFRTFPFDSINVVPLNFDFNKIKSPFNKAMLLKQLDWVTDEKVRTVLVETSKLFEATFNEISEDAAAWSAWSAESAARSARSAAWSAAWSARSAAWSARSAAWSAWSAESAARSAAWSARSAAWSARSAAWSAKENRYVWMRDLLFELIKQNS